MLALRRWLGVIDPIYPNTPATPTHLQLCQARRLAPHAPAPTAAGGGAFDPEERLECIAKHKQCVL